MLPRVKADAVHPSVCLSVCWLVSRLVFGDAYRRSIVLRACVRVCACMHAFKSKRRRDDYYAAIYSATRRKQARPLLERGTRGSSTAYRTVYLTYQHILRTVCQRRRAKFLHHFEIVAPGASGRFGGLALFTVSVLPQDTGEEISRIIPSAERRKGASRRAIPREGIKFNITTK